MDISMSVVYKLICYRHRYCDELNGFFSLSYVSIESDEVTVIPRLMRRLNRNILTQALYHKMHVICMYNRGLLWGNYIFYQIG